MAAAGLGNPAGLVLPFDGGQPTIIPGTVRNEIISGGVFVFASGATGIVSSGTNSFSTGSVLFTRDASGTQFNGICLQTSAVSGPISVVTRGVALVVANGTIVPGESVKCDGNNAVLPLGSTADSLAKGPSMVVGRAVTAGASGGYCLVELGRC